MRRRALPVIRPRNECGQANIRYGVCSKAEVIQVSFSAAPLKHPLRDMLSSGIMLLVFALVLFLPVGGLASSPKEPKRVLLLYSQEKADPAHELTDQGIREAFRSNKLFDVRLYTEYLDLGRFSLSPGSTRLKPG
jgi:hypothetical protein